VFVKYGKNAFAKLMKMLKLFIGSRTKKVFARHFKPVAELAMEEDKIRVSY